MIVDTSFFIAVDGDDPDARRKARELESESVPLRVPTAVVMELYVSVGLGSTPNANVRSMEPLLANQPVVALDENVARRAGVLLGVHRDHETKPQLGPVDAIVAATGLVFNEAVVTGDDEDFESVDGLDIETW